MAWKGDPTNKVPNIGNVNSDVGQAVAQQSEVLSEKKTDINRADEPRRDTDKQKDNTVRLIDIDTAIFQHLEKIQIQVIDDGNRIKVPIYYASPEKWKAIQKDGVIRDYNGKMILPAIVLQRVNSEKDMANAMFNKYLTYSVMKRYSEKNRYTPFSVLIGQEAPINEVYDVTMPDHMTFTYHFIIWTEYVEQMNAVVEKINFETEDYWGDLRGLRFRTRIDSFSHTIELQVDQDRIVKSEFDLIVRGYLLPDVNYKLGGVNATNRKWMTPKKIVMGTETVATDFRIETLDENREKWRNWKYPNLPKDAVIPPPPVVPPTIIQTTGSLA